MLRRSGNGGRVPFEPNSCRSASEIARAVLRRDGSTVSGHDCCRVDGAGFHPRTLRLVLHDRDGVLADTIGEYPFGEDGLLPNAGRDGSYMSPLFESFTSVASYGMHTIIGDQAKQELVILGQCTLTLSARRRVWRMGGGHMLLHERGEMDAERVARYALTRPTLPEF